MFWSGMFDGSASSLCENNEGTAAVVGALLPPDQTAPVHAPEMVGQPALLPVECAGQLHDPDLACRLVGQPGEDVEILQGQPGVGLQVAVEHRGKSVLNKKPAAPKALLFLVEPRGLGIHESTLRSA